MKELLDILSYRRPHGSHSLRQMAEAHVLPLGASPDAYGNLLLDIGPAPTIIWSAHLDTVHHDAGRQRVYANDKKIMTLPGRKGFLPNCLGADDGVGVWLLCEMIRAGIPGRYVWHQNEEHGGLGSSFIAHDGEALKGISVAMAFDRRGTKDVITHQFGGRTASDKFAASFAAILTTAGIPDYRGEEGIFTDTANYADLLPECSNLSCGYSDEHRQNESVDVRHLLRLRDALCTLNTSGLEIARKPGEDDARDWVEYFNRQYSSSSGNLWSKTANGHWVLDEEDDIPSFPFDDSRVWQVEPLTNICHCLRYDHDQTGKTLCGELVDTGDYWCVDDTWTPEEFCVSCLDIETEEGEDYQKLNDRYGQ